MKRLAIILILYSVTVQAQGEANNWYFGINAGLSFNTTPPTALTDGQLSTLEGCTTISDSSGNLLFYTDGSIIYTKNHQIMQNGTGLKGDRSSTSSALIVPVPNSTSIFYIFTVDEPHHFNAEGNSGTDGDGVNDGLMYSVVNMNLDDGNGAVVSGQKNIQLITYDPTIPLENDYKCSEKITAVKGADCTSFWVITHFLDSFYAFEVKENGVTEEPVVSNVGISVPLEGYRRNSLGYMKASPEGDKIAVAHLGLATTTGGDGPGKVLLYDLDNETGTVSNELELHDGDSPYGVEFSPSGNRLYATIGLGDAGNADGYVVQYNLTLSGNEVPDSAHILVNELGQEYTNYNAGALQLGPDGQIYRALFSFSQLSGDYLGLIKNPEALGADVIYTESEILVNVDGIRRSQIGLPPFIQSIFAEQIDIVHVSEETIDTNLNLCDGEIYLLYYDDIPGAIYTWYKNGEILPGVTGNEFLTIQPEDSSLPLSENYKLEVDLNDGSCPLIGYANLSYYQIPDSSPNLQDENYCYVQNGNEIITFNFSEIENEILSTQIPGVFQVLFFTTPQDADERTDWLPTDFSVSENETEIYVRIENISNTDCYIVQNFTLFAYEGPELEVQPIVACESQDGSDVFFDLDQFVHEHLQNEDPFVFESVFYYTLEDAENEENEVTDPENFNLNGNSTIFSKIKNSNFEQCFIIEEIEIHLNDLPEVSNASISQCSVENGGPNSWFDLTQVETEITNGASGVSVNYFTTFSETENDDNQISDPEAYPNITNPQTIYVKVTDNATGCYAVAELLLTLNLTNGTNATLIACDNDGNEDGLHSFSLSDANDDIMAGLPNDLQISYFATQQDALLEIDPLPNNYTNTTAYNQIIYARIESNTSECYGINSLNLVVEPLPDVLDDAEMVYCADWYPEPIQLQAGLLGNANSHTYLWSPGGETTSFISITDPGTYSVTVTNTNTGCSSQRNFNVIPSNAAIIEDVVVEGIENNNTVTVVLSEGNDGDYEFSLNDPLGPYQNENVFINVPAGFHTIYVRDLNGCPTTSVETSVLGFPKFFTPNNDGYNDYWQVLGVGIHNMETDIYIFDRYGKLLRKLDPSSNGWDGNYNGKSMPINDYWYRVILKNGKEYKGHFSLKR